MIRHNTIRSDERCLILYTYNSVVYGVRLFVVRAIKKQKEKNHQ